MNSSSVYTGKRHFPILTNTSLYTDRIIWNYYAPKYDELWQECNEFFKEARVINKYPLSNTNITCFKNKQSIHKLLTSGIQYFNPPAVISFLG